MAWWLAGMACLCGLLWPAAARADLPCRQIVVSGNPEYPPFLWRDPDDMERLIGANADLMQWLAKEIGIPVIVKYAGPWGRVQEETRFGRVDMIAGAFHTRQRSEYMHYFQPAIRNTRSVIWMRTDRTFRYAHWADLIDREGLTVINNSFGEAFDQYAAANLRISKVATLESALKMLSLARADYVIYEEAPGQAYAAKLNIPNLKAASTPISNEDLFLTLSHKSACDSPALRDRIAQAMQKMAREKLMDRLLEQNIQRWRKQAQ